MLTTQCLQSHTSSSKYTLQLKFIKHQPQIHLPRRSNLYKTNSDESQNSPHQNFCAENQPFQDQLEKIPHLRLLYSIATSTGPLLLSCRKLTISGPIQDYLCRKPTVPGPYEENTPCYDYCAKKQPFQDHYFKTPSQIMINEENCSTKWFLPVDKVLH